MQAFVKQRSKVIGKNLGWIVFTIPPYSPKLNQIEHTFE